MVIAVCTKQDAVILKAKPNNNASILREMIR